MDHEDLAYKIDSSVQSSLLSFLVLTLIWDSIYWLALSYNTDFHIKEHKLYNKLLNEISSEIELSASKSSGKDGLTSVHILYISIFHIYPFIPFKKILLLIFLYLLFSISLHLHHLS